MKQYTDSLVKRARKYNTLNDPEKAKLLQQLYVQELASFPEIADLTDTYAQKIRRDAKRLGIKARSRSEAQSIAIKQGRHAHPMKGRSHSEESKIQISETAAQSWESKSDEEKELHKERGREQWKNMSEEDKKDLQKKAGDAIRQAAKDGSKLELYLREKLIGEGYPLEYGVEHIIESEKLHIDMLLRHLNIAIEVDGPSHHEPIWGAKTLTRNQKSDSIKNALLMARGMVLIRVKQTQNNLSEKYKRDLFKSLLEAVQKIEKKFPAADKRYIEIKE